MNLSQFEQVEINDHACYVAAPFLIVQNDGGAWNAYKNGSSVQKILIRKELDEDGNPVDVVGAKEYTTPEDAAADCTA